MFKRIGFAVFFLLIGSGFSFAGCLDDLTGTSSVTEQLSCLREEVSESVGTRSETVELPVGVIVAWANEGPVPSGWAICNGDNGTPDLRGKFLRGVGTYGESGDDPSGTDTHRHSASSQAVGRPGDPHTVAGTDQGNDSQWWTLFSHTHGISVGSSSHIPPNYKVVYIMKTE